MADSASVTPSSAVDSMTSFSTEFKSLTLSSGFQKRPDQGGKDGKPIEILANVYPIKLKDPSKAICHYDIQITPTEIPRPGGRAVRPRTGAEQADQERGLPVKVCRQIWEALGVQHPDLQPVMRQTAYDGRKAAFTPMPFPCGEQSEIHMVTLPGHNLAHNPNAQPREFRVKIARVGTIDMNLLLRWLAGKDASDALAEASAVCIQALDVLLRHDQFLQNSVITGGQGRKFFDGTSGSGIGQGAEVLRGFFQSARPTRSGLVLNLDTAYSPFLIPGPLDQLCFAILGKSMSTHGGGNAGRGGAARGGRGGRGGGRGGFQQAAGNPVNAEFAPHELRELLMKLRGAKVRVKHRASTKEYVVVGFGQPADKHTFGIDSGPRGAQPTVVDVARAAAAGGQRPVGQPAPQTQTTVQAYFKSKYNFILRFPFLQVVELRGHEFVPLEALELLPGVGIPPTRLSRDQGAAMIKVAAQAPPQRKALIDAERVKIAYENNDRINAWGLETAPTMLSLKARVLPPPEVVYSKQGKQPSVGRGQWNLVDTVFTTPNVPLEHWGVICFARENFVTRPQVENFMGELVKQMKARGMAVVNPRPFIDYGDMRGAVQGVPNYLVAIRGMARKIITNPKNTKNVAPQLFVFILDDPKTYDDVKRAAMLGLPVPVVSQVLLAKNVVKDRLDQYCGNVSMKLNAKLFGANWVIDPKDLPKITNRTIIFGADVTHPPAARAGENVAASISAVVATQSGVGGAGTYGWQVRLQEGRQEVITDLKEMAVLLLRGWIGKSKGFPDSIIFYRDGVSEGQYAAVVDHEIRALKDACRIIDPTGKWMPKLTFVVAAKRHNIRFFAKNPADADRTGNLPAGLVVDTSVTAPYLFDFYLQSQAGLVGTARPTHYVVLLDENAFTSDSMEKLTNSLCYSFARATRSVSIVPVAYYADILCTKTRALAYEDDSVSIASGSILPPRHIQDKLERVFQNENTKMGGKDHLSGMWYL